MVVSTVRLAASQFSKINKPIFFRFQTVCSCKTQVTVEKNLSRRLRYDLVQLEGNSCPSTSLKESKVSSTVTSLREIAICKFGETLGFYLTKILFLKRLIGVSRLIAEVLNDQNIFTESNFAKWFSSYVQFCSSGHFLERAEAGR